MRDGAHRITEYSDTMVVLSDARGDLVAILHGPAAYDNALALSRLLERLHRAPAPRGPLEMGFDVCS